VSDVSCFGFGVSGFNSKLETRNSKLGKRIACLRGRANLADPRQRQAHGANDNDGEKN
jgi:hypothetical protein